MHKAFLVLLVDAVVGQVDEVVAQLCGVVGVLVRGKPGHQVEQEVVTGEVVKPDEAFLVEVNLEGIDSSEKNIEAEIKFAAIDQQRVVNVLLHAHLALLVRNLL